MAEVQVRKASGDDVEAARALLDADPSGDAVYFVATILARCAGKPQSAAESYPPEQLEWLEGCEQLLKRALQLGATDTDYVGTDEHLSAYRAWIESRR